MKTFQGRVTMIDKYNLWLMQNKQTQKIKT